MKKDKNKIRPIPKNQNTLPGLILGLFVLSLSACALIFFLKPQVDSASAPESPKHTSIGKARTHEKRGESSTTFASSPMARESPTQGVNPSALPVAPQEKSEYPSEVWDGPAGQGVEIIAAGQIRLTEEQSEMLKGSSSWGGSKQEARALIDSIPAEAFTSDW